MSPVSIVTDDDPAATRAAFDQDGELPAAIEPQRRFPGIADNAHARACARGIAGWSAPPVPSRAAAHARPSKRSELSGRLGGRVGGAFLGQAGPPKIRAQAEPGPRTGLPSMPSQKNGHAAGDCWEPLPMDRDEALRPTGLAKGMIDCPGVRDAAFVQPGSSGDADAPGFLGAEAAYEFADLMVVVTGSLEQLRRQPLDRQGQRQLARADWGAWQAVQLARQALFRAQGGDGKAEVEAVDLNAAVARFVGAIGQQVELHVQLVAEPRRRGTGLGLWMARRFASMCGGKIDVEATPGQGTTIRLALPCCGAVEPG